MTQTILDGCRLFGLDLPVSGRDLHEVFSVFRLEKFEHNAKESACWRGVCDCLDLYAGPDHAASRAVIMDDLELLSREKESGS